MASLQIPLALWKDHLELPVSTLLAASQHDWLFLGLRTGRIIQVVLAPPSGASAQTSRMLIGHTAPIKSLLLARQPSDQGPIDSVAVLVSLDERGGVALWSIEDGRCLLHNVLAIDGGAMGMCLSSGGDFVFLYGRTSFVNVVRLSTLEVVQSIPLRDSIWVARAIVRQFNEDRDELILIPTSGRDLLKIHFDAKTAKALSTSAPLLGELSMEVRSIAISGDRYYMSDGRNLWISSFGGPGSSPPQLVWDSPRRRIADLLVLEEDVVLMLLFDGTVVKLRGKDILGTDTVPDEAALHKYSMLCRWKDECWTIAFPTSSLRIYSLDRKKEVVLPLIKTSGFKGVSCTTIFSRNGSESVIHGMSDGSIRILNLFDGFMVLNGLMEETVTMPPVHECAITCLLVAKLERTRGGGDMEKILFSADMSGTVVVWDLQRHVKLKVLRWHTAPICAIVPIASHQRCVVIDVQGRASIVNTLDWTFYGFLGMRLVPIQRVKYTLEGDLKIGLFYVDGKTQLWNVPRRTCEKEFTPSNLDESIHSFPGSWEVPWAGQASSVTQFFADSHPVLGSAFSWRPNVPLVEPLQVALLDVRKAIDNLRRVLTSDEATLQGRATEQLKSALLFIMSLLLPWDIDDEIDACAHRLGFSRRRRGVVLGMLGANGNISFPGPHDTGEEWRLSGTMSAMLFLALSTIFELPIDLGDDWDRLRMAYYGRVLETGLHRQQVALPSFAFTSKYWHDLDEEIRHGSRLLIVQTLSKMDEGSIRRIVDHWSCLLPANESDSGGRKMNRAAVILGILAVHRPEFLSTDTRKMIAESLMRQLMDEKRNLFRSAAIELVGRAYHVWEGKIHALSVFKLLHSWLSNMSQIDEKSSVAQLIVPFENASALDTLDAVRGTLLKLAAAAPAEIIPAWLGQASFPARNLTERWTSVSLLDDLVRQKPHVLKSYVSLAGEMICRLLESGGSVGGGGSSSGGGGVVGSGTGGSKQRMLAIVMPLILDLVQIYPTVAYHRDSFRMATTSPPDLRIHLHDLRGSSFVRHFEGHTQPITALAFSPDGRMLVSYSMDEATLRWWHVPSGLISLLSGSVRPFRTDVVDPALTEAARTLVEALGGEAAEGIVEISIKWSEEHSISIYAKDECVYVVAVPS